MADQTTLSQDQELDEALAQVAIAPSSCSSREALTPPARRPHPPGAQTPDAGAGVVDGVSLPPGDVSARLGAGVGASAPAPTQVVVPPRSPTRS